MKEISWLFFNTVIPLTPVAVVLFFSWLTKDTSKKIPLFTIIKDGQIFFYCTALTSVALGDLEKVPDDFKMLPWIMGFLLIILISTVAFSVAAYEKDAFKEKQFGWCSVAMVIVAVLTVYNFKVEGGLL